VCLALFGCSAVAPAGPPPTVAARVLERLPHDDTAFTEGLFVRDGHLFESTGLEGDSVIRQTDLATGKVIREVEIDPQYFGEGIVDWGDEIVSVTWRTGIGFRWKLGTLTQSGTFKYPGEGWGLTRTDDAIVLSDGTPALRFLDPVTMVEKRRVTVTDNGQPVPMLNELEWVDGEILANIWHADRIARIDPASGRVKGWIDISAIAKATPQRDAESVANGIAWDAKQRRLYITGKNWPTLYRIAWPVK
jgi:glutaminyl-peptide cyclotransferase